MDNVAGLSAKQRSELFEESASLRNLQPAIIEKDFWVCWLLKKLFNAPVTKKTGRGSIRSLLGGVWFRAFAWTACRTNGVPHSMLFGDLFSPLLASKRTRTINAGSHCLELCRRQCRIDSLIPTRQASDRPGGQYRRFWLG